MWTLTEASPDVRHWVTFPPADTLGEEVVVVGPHIWVNARLTCRHGRERTFCVRVDREVPEKLRCSPGGGGVDGGGTLTGCECSAGLTGADLTRLVIDAVRRGWGRWMSIGAVVVEC